MRISICVGWSGKSEIFLLSIKISYASVRSEIGARKPKYDQEIVNSMKVNWLNAKYMQWPWAVLLKMENLELTRGIIISYCDCIRIEDKQLYSNVTELMVLNSSNRTLAASHFIHAVSIFFLHMYNQKFLDPNITSCLMTLQNMVHKIGQSGAWLVRVLIRAYHIYPTRQLQFWWMKFACNF